MGQIAAAYDLMPESTEVDLDNVIAQLSGVLPAGVKLLETKIGGKLEDALRAIPGIENVECVSNTVV